MIVVGFLMVSEVKYPDFKGHSAVRTSFVALALVAIIVGAALVYDYHTWAVMIFAGYVLFGIFNTAMNMVRK